jgi:hypothetical protein
MQTNAIEKDWRAIPACLKSVSLAGGSVCGAHDRLRNCDGKTKPDRPSERRDDALSKTFCPSHSCTM